MATVTVHTGVMSPSVLVLAAVALALPAPLLAQGSVPQPPANVPVTSAPLPGTPSGPDIGIAGWRVRPDVDLKKPLPGSALEGIPRWNLGFRAERQLFSRLSVGGMATLSRGEDGPLVSATELGTGRDLSQTGSLTGPGTYRTVLNTDLTFSVPLKDTGHFNLKAIGELWNPFSADRRKGENGSDIPLPGRAFKIGLRTTF
jgi:hypothetical protein